MHATLTKFGYPATLLRDYEHWCVLLRPSQVTLGSLVLCAKSEANSLGTLPTAAFAELSDCTRHIEQALMAFRPFNKINYLALMMVDPHVHFHVLPRYASAPAFEDHEFPDSAWPGPPDLKQQMSLTPDQMNTLQSKLLDAFTKVI